jgi:integrase
MKTKGVNKVTVRGRVYYYDRRTGERLPDDESARQKRMLEIARGAVVKQSKSGVGTIGDLIARYRASPHFNGLAKRSRETYGKHLAHLEADFGDIAVKYVDREWLVELRDGMAATPRMADQCIQVIRILLDYAPGTPVAVSPAVQRRPRHIKSINVSEPHEAWPDELVKAFRKAAYPELRLVVEIGMNTGWTNYDGSRLTWRQVKTKGELSVPVTAELKALLDTAPRKAAVICTTKTGRPWREDHLRPELQRQVEALAYRGYSFHGLRHRTGYLLAEAGCTEHEIAAVLGHKSLAMVRRYTMAANRAKMAGAAIVKLEHSKMPVLQNARTNGSEGK